MKYKLITSDIDNTLVNRKFPNLSDYSVSVFNKIIENDILFVPCSGRPLSSLPDDVMNLNIKYAIVSNGARIFDLSSNKAIFSADINYKLASNILKYLKENNHLVSSFFNEYIYVDNQIIDDARDILNKFRSKTRIKTLENLDEYVLNNKIDVEKVIVFFNDMDTKEKCIDSINKLFPEVLVTSSGDNNIEINNPNASKGNGLSFLCDYLGINRKDTIAIGDNINDLSMLEIAGLSIVPNDGTIQAKSIANIISDSVGNDGVAKTLDEILIKGDKNG